MSPIEVFGVEHCDLTVNGLARSSASTQPPSPSPTQRVHDMIFGAWGTQAIYVAAKLGIPDLLAGGPRTSAELAEATAAHAPSLRRLMRFLTALGVCAQVGEESFELTAIGELLRSGVPSSARSMAIWYCEQFWPAWGQLLESVRTGRTGFDLATGKLGADVITGDPANAAVLNEFMADATAREAGAFLAAYDFSAFVTIADVGGGYGALMAAILRANPTARGIVLDLPHSVEGARSRLQAAGVEARCEIRGGSFFDAVPAGADAYLLKNVLHDWNDERAGAILRNCRRAMGARTGAGAARLIILEQVVPESVQATREHAAATRMDLTMMMGGGCERTAAEWRALLNAAGLEAKTIVPTATVLSIIEAAATIPAAQAGDRR
jgi:orsellinic acid C2-O-methyltransferase